MIQNKIIFPKFESGQLLTSDLLNDYTSYLEKQDRHTRSSLIGSGVVGGLFYSYADGVLTIKAGTAVTADGFFIHLKKDRTYTCSAPFEKVSEELILCKHPLTEEKSESFNGFREKIEYVLFEDDEDAKIHEVNSSSGIPYNSNYALALVVDFPRMEVDKCNQYTCDRIPLETEIEVRPVLVKKRTVQNVPLYLKLTAIDHVSQLTLMADFDTSMNINVLSNRTVKLYVGNAHIIYESLTVVLKKFAVLNVDDSLRSLLDWSTVMPDYKDKIQMLDACRKYFLKESKRLDDLKKGELPQYFLLFLEDMRDAINEFISFFNVFAWKYPFVRTSESMVDRIVMIRESDREANAYSYLFSPVQRSLSYEVDCKILSGLIRRIYKMRNAFLRFRYGKTSEKIDFVLKKSFVPMGENKLPFYYDKKKLQNFWDPFSGSTCVAVSPDFSRTQGESDILRFHNCYGKDVYEVKSKLEEYLLREKITSIRVKTYSIGKRRLKDRYYEVLNNVFNVKKAEIENRLADMYMLRLKKPFLFNTTMTVMSTSGEIKTVDARTLSSRVRNGLKQHGNAFFMEHNGNLALVKDLGSMKAHITGEMLKDPKKFAGVYGFAVLAAAGTQEKMHPMLKGMTASQLKESGAINASSGQQLQSDGVVAKETKNSLVTQMKVTDTSKTKLAQQMQESGVLAGTKEDANVEVAKQEKVQINAGRQPSGKIEQVQMAGSLSESLAEIFQATGEERVDVMLAAHAMLADNDENCSFSPYERTHASVIFKVADALSFNYMKKKEPSKKGLLAYSVTEANMKRKSDAIGNAIENAHDAEAIALGDIELIMDSIKDITFDEFRIFYEFIRPMIGDETGYSLYSKDVYKNKYFAAFFALRSYVKLGYTPAYKDAIYCGGAQKEADIVLIYHKTRKGSRFILELCNKKFK
ncbi:MAG: hypothetical protein J6T28_03650 [Paludibacteraceae bacterium]|nr:hypothetical protein [Paludibacteraceae bacterium]